jgi:hypothetical protein
VESERIDFLIRRDGHEKAREFAVRTLRAYRKCLLMTGNGGRKFHHASLPQYRRSFVESYLYLKRFARASARSA